MNTISKDIVLVSKDHCVWITHKHCYVLEMITWSEINKEDFFLIHIIQHFFAFLLTIEHCELLKKKGWTLEKMLKDCIGIHTKTYW